VCESLTLSFDGREEGMLGNWIASHRQQWKKELNHVVLLLQIVFAFHPAPGRK
jgi:hypothetical protein